MAILSLKKVLAQSFVGRIYTCFFSNARKDRTIEMIEVFAGKNLPRKEKASLIRDIRQAYIKYTWNPFEFFIFDYQGLSKSRRKGFITEMQKENLAIKLNSTEVCKLFDCKWNTYMRFTQYYKRDICPFLSKNNNPAKLEDFISRHEDFILKPIDDSMGKGIAVLHKANVDTIIQMMNDYPSGIIVEELIKQSDQMASIHPQSVNTIRIHTFNVKGQVHIHSRPFARFGRRGGVVDNAAQGGIFAAIDFKTGIVTAAMDEFGNKYIIHPETQKSIVGFQIPRWQEALIMAKELATVVPEAVSVGWDLACVDDGWVMVEGNSRGQFIGQQMFYRTGVREELLSIDPILFSIK